MPWPRRPEAAVRTLLCAVLALAGSSTALGEQAASSARTLQAGTLDAGLVHTCAVLDDGSAWCWGRDEFGQLGDGAPFADQASPAKVALPTGRRAVALSAGGFHTCAVLDDGSAWCWGRNIVGQLGNGSPNIGPPVPVRVALPTDRRAVAISAGDSHTCAVLDDGSLACWGSDSLGQIGNGVPLQTERTPVIVGLAGARPAAVSAGGFHTCVALTDGSARCWGDNLSGQLGDNGVENQFAPAAVALGAGRRVVAISAGSSSSTCVLYQDAGTGCWGRDDQGAVGNGEPLANVRVPSDVALAGGVAITATGHACWTSPAATYCWGDDFHGQLGNGPALVADQPSPSVVFGIPSADRS